MNYGWVDVVEVNANGGAAGAVVDRDAVHDGSAAREI